ncbi:MULTISPECIES: (2Fe-2S)-binding protein, partial [Vibrio]|uniref:(2Fe-2S)-binding protein n=1 Tax=Vibrio TaxID=662 RepID=UPI001CDC24F4
EQMNEWIRIRPGFTHQLMSDGILACLLRLQQHFPQLTDAIIKEHASLWLSALGLDERHIDALHGVPHEQPLNLVRKSCCLVYKCEGRKLCEDCPRAAKNRQLIMQKSKS